MPVIDGAPVAMDEFKFIPGVFVYLLSHMHADHTSGLTELWDFGTVYCSPVSRRLLIDKFHTDPSRVVALELNVPHQIRLDEANRWRQPRTTPTKENGVKPACDDSAKTEESREETQAVKGAEAGMVSCRGSTGARMGAGSSGTVDDEDSHVHTPPPPGHTMTVTLIDADHCPGSVMFVLEGFFGTVLYTGDFRYNASLHSTHALTDRRFDTVFLDNTYCNEQAAFPARSEVAKAIVDQVKFQVGKLGRRVLLGIDSLGKEELLTTLTEATGERICVTPLRMQWLKHCEIDSELFTTNPNIAKVHVVSKRTVTPGKIRMLREEGVDAIGIRPTGWAHEATVGSTEHNTDNLDRSLADRAGGSTLGASGGGTENLARLERRGAMDSTIAKATIASARPRGGTASYGNSPLGHHDHEGLVKWFPYSLHSSYDELRTFCAHLTFGRIHPIVHKAFGMAGLEHMIPATRIINDGTSSTSISPVPDAVRAAMAECSKRPRRAPGGYGGRSKLKRQRTFGASFASGSSATPGEESVSRSKPVHVSVSAVRAAAAAAAAAMTTTGSSGRRQDLRKSSDATARGQHAGTCGMAADDDNGGSGATIVVKMEKETRSGAPQVHETPSKVDQKTPSADGDFKAIARIKSVPTTCDAPTAQKKRGQRLSDAVKAEQTRNKGDRFGYERFRQFM